MAVSSNFLSLRAWLLARAFSDRLAFDCGFDELLTLPDGFTPGLLLGEDGDENFGLLDELSPESDGGLLDGLDGEVYFGLPDELLSGFEGEGLLGGLEGAVYFGLLDDPPLGLCGGFESPE